MNDVEANPWLPLTEFDYHRRLSKSRGVSLVLFGAPHCGACTRAGHLAPRALADCVDHFYRIDVQISTALAREFGLFHLPAMFLYRNGRFHAQLHSPLSADALRQAALRTLAGPAGEEP